jgi:RIP metalloprotease RseP
MCAGASAVKDVVEYVKGHRDVSIDVTVARLPEKSGDRLKQRPAPEIRHVQVLPDIGKDGTGKIGVQLAPNAQFVVKQATGPADVLSQSAANTWRLLRATFDGFVGIVTNWGKASESVSGPIAVVAVGAEVARSSPTGLYSFAAAVNVNLAVVNVLPLPALDGGYLLLLAIEALRRGKKLPKSAEALFNVSGFLLVAGAGSFLLLRDAFNLLPK